MSAPARSRTCVGACQVLTRHPCTYFTRKRASKSTPVNTPQGYPSWVPGASFLDPVALSLETAMMDRKELPRWLVPAVALAIVVSYVVSEVQAILARAEC